MKKTIRIFLGMILCLAYVGCEKEYGEQPMGFMRLVNAYEKGAVFLSAETGGLASVINFTDGSSLRIDDFEIHDYRYKEIPEVYYQEKKWYVDGEETEAPYTPKLATVRSHPVFVCYDKTTLYAWASNGKLLKFKSIANLQNIPVVRITTDGGAPIPDKVNYVPGTVTIEDPEEIYSKVSSFSARMGIRGRGNSSWREAKKPWKIKLDEQAKLLGMPADRDWCLLANFVDVTGLRNLVAMRISEICGFSWTPKMRNVEVYLNDVYQGIYTLSEHKEVNGHKVNITPAGPGDNEGGVRDRRLLYGNQRLVRFAGAVGDVLPCADGIQGSGDPDPGTDQLHEAVCQRFRKRIDSFVFSRPSKRLCSIFRCRVDDGFLHSAGAYQEP